ncbi:MAG: hypothetical protein MJ252_09055, partial [archaeon]|nr:hypothetical protein [archaeon]
MSDNLCTYDLINNTKGEERCQFVKANCHADYINFLRIHYCYFKATKYYSFPIFFLILVILFYLLSDTSNTFLSSSLTKIVDKLELNQNLAGVTLLALGNGASDVISSLVASTEIDGLEFSVGSLVGSGMFLTSFCLGLVAYYGENVSVVSKMFNRDIILFLISLIFFIIASLDKKISLFESLGFIGIYLINVLFAFLQDCQQKKEKKENEIGFIGGNLYGEYDDIKNTTNTSEYEYQSFEKNKIINEE